MIAVSEGILRELQILGYALLLGGGLAAAYDVLRIFRRVIPRGIVPVSLEDLCYWIAVWIIVFSFLFQENSGGIRGYIAGAIVLGAAVYHYLLGRWIIKGCSYVIARSKKELKKLGKAVTIILEKHFK